MKMERILRTLKLKGISKEAKICRIEQVVKLRNMDYLHQLIDMKDYVEDVNVADVALGVAVEFRNVDAVKFLSQTGADVNQYVRKNTPLLIKAIENGPCEFVEHLITAGADVNIQTRDKGNTPLIVAGTSGDVKCTKRLLSAGANTNQTNYDSDTALLKSFEMDDFLNGFIGNDILPLFSQIFNFFLKKKNLFAFIAVFYPCSTNFSKFWQSIENTIFSTYLYITAAVSISYIPDAKFTEIMKLLIGAGANVNHSDQYGWTTLLEVALVGN